MDSNLKQLGRCSYYDLAGNGYCLSGDIVDGGPADGNGVAEFIDIDIEKMKEMGARYFVFSVNSYTEQLFCELPNMHFGFMEREEMNSGEIFEPSTVQQKVKLNSNSTTAITCMFDIEKMEMIWIDEVGQDVFRSNLRVNNIDANWLGTNMVCYKALHMEKANISDVIRLNAEARNGEIVENKEDADLVFSLNEGITPMDFDFFSGELIPKEVSACYLPKEEVVDDISEEIPEEVRKEEN